MEQIPHLIDVGLLYFSKRNSSLLLPRTCSSSYIYQEDTRAPLGAIMCASRLFRKSDLQSKAITFFINLIYNLKPSPFS